MSLTKPLALVSGTGNHGTVIVNALLERGHFAVAVLTRASSATKPEILAFKDRGVQIRIADIASDPVAALVDALHGAEVVVAAVAAPILDKQWNLIQAAKEAGVKRFVPADFGPYTPPGVRSMMDLKYSLREFIKEIGLGHTFIDIGWWMQFALPLPETIKGPMQRGSLEFCGDGTKKSALTDLYDVGKFVARILEDGRTLGRYVFIWGDERTRNEVFETAERASGLSFVAKKIPLSAEEVLADAARGKAGMESEPGVLMHWFLREGREYQYSMDIRGDNTVKNAVAAGALDAQELYPDVEVKTLEEFAREFYKKPYSFETDGKTTYLSK